MHRSFESIQADLLNSANRITSYLDSDAENLSTETSEKFSNLLEEMHVAYEEMQMQNEELIRSIELILDQRSSYMTLFDSSPTPFITTDSAGVVRSANKAAGQLFAVKPTFLEGKPLALYLSQRDRNRMYETLDSLNKGYRAVEWESTIVPRDHPALPVIINTSGRLALEGELLWTFQDISHRVALEKARQYDQMNDFLAVLMHDLKVPVVGSALVLQHLRKLEGEPIDSHKDKLDVLDRTMRMILKKIESLTEIYKLQATSNEQSLSGRRLELIDVDSLMEECKAVTESSALAGGVEVQTSVEPDATLEASYADLQRIIVCLVDNAIKSSSRDSKVRIAARMDNNEFIVCVEDWGCGLSEEEQNNLFERIWQGRTPDKVSSSGLGLYLCKKIIDLYHGTIRCESEPGKGSRFTIRLPASIRHNA